MTEELVLSEEWFTTEEGRKYEIAREQARKYLSGLDYRYRTSVPGKQKIWSVVCLILIAQAVYPRLERDRTIPSPDICETSQKHNVAKSILNLWGVTPYKTPEQIAIAVYSSYKTRNLL